MKQTWSHIYIIYTTRLDAVQHALLPAATEALKSGTVDARRGDRVWEGGPLPSYGGLEVSPLENFGKYSLVHVAHRAG